MPFSLYVSLQWYVLIGMYFASCEKVPKGTFSSWDQFVFTPQKITWFLESPNDFYGMLCKDCLVSNSNQNKLSIVSSSEIQKRCGADNADT